MHAARTERCALSPEELRGSNPSIRLCTDCLQVARRVVKSYKLWLDFLGMYLVDERTGQVGRNTNGNFNNR